MKIISYILLGVSLLLAIIALVFMMKIDKEKRIAVLDSLRKARIAKAAKKSDVEVSDDLQNEIEGIENLQNNRKDHASKKEESK